MPPAEQEVDLACRVVVLKTIRMFFATPDDKPLGEGGERLLRRWRQLPQPRRVAALLGFHRMLWQGLLERLQSGGPKPGEKPYAYFIKKGAVWHD